MAEVVVHSDHPVTLVGGGDVSAEDLNKCLRHAPLCVAADGGADAVLAHGVRPQRVIGDLDSISPAARADLADVLVEVSEQDSTDFEKCLSRIAAPLILACGFTGARVDHSLGAMSVLARYADRRVIAVGGSDCIFAAPPEIGLDLAAGTRLSLFPMAPVTGRGTGLRWPIDGIDFAPAGIIGTSNVTTGPVRLAFDGPGMLVLLPPDALGAAIAGLSRPER